jgi:Tfp pilus assembly protein PilN
VPELYLQAIEQREGEVTIKGLSPNEYAVTKFGQSLEFSGGLFNNLFIETAMETPQDTQNTGAAGESTTARVPVVAFTVKANYGAPKQQQQNAQATPAQAANNMAQAAQTYKEVNKKPVIVPPVPTAAK